MKSLRVWLAGSHIALIGRADLGRDGSCDAQIVFPSLVIRCSNIRKKIILRVHSVHAFLKSECAKKSEMLRLRKSPEK